MGERNVITLHILLIGVVLLSAIVGALGAVNPNLAPRFLEVPGDTDGNKRVDIYDAVKILQYSNGQKVSINLANADVDKNKVVNSLDAEKVLLLAYGVEEKETISGVNLGPGVPQACSGTFIRYDIDNSGGVNIADAVAHLSILFPNPQTQPPVLPCIDKADSNDDNVQNIADVVYALSYMFAGGFPIAPTYYPDSSSVAETSPGVDEQCDGVDNDNDGTVDEECTVLPVWTVFSTETILQLPLGNTAQEALDNADQACNNDAIAQGHTPGIYVAWLSNSMIDARDRIVDGEYINVFGDTIANDKNDLLDGTLNQIIWSIPYPCSITTPGCNGRFYYTGTGSDGTKTIYHCNDWTLGSGPLPNQRTMGLSLSVNSEWTSYYLAAPCMGLDEPGSGNLLCFQVA